MSSGKATEDTAEKKKALKPNADSGKAVADPRWFGQFRADVLIEPAKAAQPPTPVRKAKKHSQGIDSEPGPPS